jgi:4-amino-4-deoxy-L-arabinose transferase-like glycosyltransferase
MLARQFGQGLLVAAVAGLVMLAGLGRARLWDRDEPRNAGAAREMLQRGDWVVPTFNGQLRAHKPVLLYWCIMVAYQLLGVHELSARLPSALAAVLTVLCTWRMGRRLFGTTAGVWAGIILASSLLFVMAGRAATPDSLLILGTTLAMTWYVHGTFRPRFETTPPDTPPEWETPGACFPQSLFPVVVLYAAMGLAVLAKGPVGYILPMAVLGTFGLVLEVQRHRAACPVHEEVWWQAAWHWLGAACQPKRVLRVFWQMRPVLGLFIVAAVALPWYLAVGFATHGEFLKVFFFEHHLGRATMVMEHHSGSLLFYPVAMLVGFFPWSIFAIPLAIDTALQLTRRDRQHPGYLFAVCWILVYVVLFSLARTKLPSYVTPCYPALALLAGDYVDRWSRQAAAVAGRWLLAAFGCLALVGAALTVAIPFILRDVAPGEEWLGLIGTIPLIGGVLCFVLAAGRSFRSAAGMLGIAAVAFVALLFSVGAWRLDRHQQQQRLWHAVAARGHHAEVASYRVLEPSWVFYWGRPIAEFGGGAGSAQLAGKFLQQHPERYLITTRDRVDELKPYLPPEVVVIEEVPYFLRGKQRLVLLGTAHPMVEVAQPHRLMAPAAPTSR